MDVAVKWISYIEPETDLQRWAHFSQVLSKTVLYSFHNSLGSFAHKISWTNCALPLYASNLLRAVVFFLLLYSFHTSRFFRFSPYLNIYSTWILLYVFGADLLDFDTINFERELRDWESRRDRKKKIQAHVFIANRFM